LSSFPKHGGRPQNGRKKIKISADSFLPDMGTGGKKIPTGAQKCVEKGRGKRNMAQI